MNPLRHPVSCLVLAATLLLGACSTTRRLGEGEVLYTGVHRIRIEADSGVVLSAAAESAAREPLSVAPNNPLYSPYLRTLLPIGLWAYNYCYTPREKGFRYWFYKRLAKQPVLLSAVQPELRTRVAVQALENYGHFGSQAACSLRYRKHGRKARVDYTLHVAPPYTYSRIAYPQPEGTLCPLFDSLQATSLLRPGAQYNLDTLTQERSRIAAQLRNRGYYYFRPEYLEYLADTTLAPRRVDLRLVLKPDVPAAALESYRVGGITVALRNVEPGPADTLRLRDAEVVAQRPLKLRPRVLARALALRRGELFTVDAQNRTLNELGKLGVFRSVGMSVPPLDSLHGSREIDVRIDAQFDYPVSVSLETDVTSKSNSFLGPGISLKLSDNNLFRGGEVFSVALDGSYEWQTGNKNSGGRSSRLNSYELGLNATLDVPRLLAFGRLSGRLPAPRRTSFQLGLNLMNRPDYFRLIAFSGSAGYDFRTSPSSSHTLTVLKLVYNRLLHTTESFDETLEANPAIALSFRNQFIPSVGYTYTFDRSYGATSDRRFYWQNSFSAAGNLLAGVLRLCGEPAAASVRQPLLAVRQERERGEVLSPPRTPRQLAGDTLPRGGGVCLRQLRGDALQRAVLHRRRQQHPRLHRAVDRPGQLPSARRRPQRLPGSDGRLQARGQRRVPLRHHGAPPRRAVPRCGQHLAAEKRSPAAGRRTQVAGILERDRPRHGLRPALRHQLPGAARRPRHRHPHALSEPRQAGLL